jgi:hypothetical protein
MAEEQVMGYFDADEWKLVSAAPATAGIYTALGSKNEISDKEWEALGAALDPESVPDSDQLLKAAMRETYDAVNAALASKTPPTLMLGEVDMTNPDALRQAVLSYFRRVNTALSDVPVTPRTNYKNSILLVGQKVAESQAEGGFLGIGARDISAGEIQALKDVAGALGFDTSVNSEWSQRILVPAATFRTGGMPQ